MRYLVEILDLNDQGRLEELKNEGTNDIYQCPFEKMPLLCFDYVKTADFGSEKIFLLKPFFIKITLLTMCQNDFCIRKSCFRAFVSIKFGYLKWLFSTKRLVTKKTKALKRGLLMQKSF